MQMTTFRYVCSISALIALLSWPVCSYGDSKVNSHVLLTYSSKTGVTPSFLLLRSHDRRIFKLTLFQDMDTYKQAIVLELILHNYGKSDIDEPNLFDPTGKLHGYQKYDFAALDFTKGIRKSLYGDRRELLVRGSKLRMFVKIVKVGVKKVPEINPGSPEYRFNNLVLDITGEGFTLTK